MNDTQKIIDAMSKREPPATSSYLAWAVLLVLSGWVAVNIYWDREAYVRLKGEVQAIQYQLDKSQVQPADVLKELRLLRGQLTPVPVPDLEPDGGTTPP
mgnify:CR=1 FL=1